MNYDTAPINNDTTDVLGVNEFDLEGNFTVNLTNGMFKAETSDTLKIKRNSGGDLASKLYGTFHGPAGEGETGVFHDAVDTPTIIGGMIGTKQATQ